MNSEKIDEQIITVGDIKEVLDPLNEDLEIQIEENTESTDVFITSTFYEVIENNVKKLIKITSENIMNITHDHQILDIKRICTLNLHGLKVQKIKDSEEKEKIRLKVLEDLEAKNKASENRTETKISELEILQDMENDFNEDEDDEDETEEISTSKIWNNEFESNDENDFDQDDEDDDEESLDGDELSLD